MAANQGAANTSKKPAASRTRDQPGWSEMYWSTLVGFNGRWGNSEPGTAASASRNSSTSAVRMLVSRRHELRASAIGPPCQDRTGAGWVDSSLGSTSPEGRTGEVGTGRHSDVPSPLCPTREVSSIVISPQRPVTSNRPRATSRPPPT